MEIERDRSSALIIKSLDVLSEQVDSAYISDSEKEIAKLLLNKLKAFFCKKMDSLGDNIEKILNLQCYMTDIIADMNNVICNGADIVEYAEKINSKLHDQEIVHLVGKQKYLKYKLR